MSESNDFVYNAKRKKKNQQKYSLKMFEFVEEAAIIYGMWNIINKTSTRFIILGKSHSTFLRH